MNDRPQYRYRIESYNLNLYQVPFEIVHYPIFNADDMLRKQYEMTRCYEIWLTDEQKEVIIKI
jgi:hypothetical protein